VLFVSLAATLPVQYRANATILVAPPSFSSSLQPEPIGVEGFQAILESDAVLGAAVRRLAADGRFEADDPEGLRRHLSSRVFKTGPGRPQVLVPFIELRARAALRDQAQRIAEVWVDVFLETSSSALAEQTEEATAFVGSQYAERQADVERLTTQRDRAAIEYTERIDAQENARDREIARLRSEGDRAVAEFAAETESRTAAYQGETRHLMQPLRELSAEVSSLIPDAGAGTRGLESAWRELVALRMQLAQTQRLVSLARAITDDALWQTQVSPASGRDILERVLDNRLQSQELNPFHQQLALRVVEAESSLESYDLPEDLREVLREAARSVEDLQRDRSTGLDALVAGRAAEERALGARHAIGVEVERRRSDTAIVKLSAERARGNDAFNREIAMAVESLQAMSTLQAEASLAVAGRDIPQLRLVSPVWTSTDQPPSLLASGLIGLLIGSVLGLLVAVASERNAGGELLP